MMGMARGTPVVRIQGLSKCFGNTLAVDNVTFDVEDGELLTLLGPSGCGKTTTMRSIAGLEKISSGEIYLNDKLVSSIPQRVHISPEKRDIGMVFQSYAIWPHMSVFDNVAYPLRCRKVKRKEIYRRVRDGLRLVEMEAYANRPATQLSGGQQQRIALARSMVMEPSVLLLDEPLSNLDAKLRAQMRMHIKDLQRKTGLTMIYVTHDQVEAMALSDRIIVMNRGVIEQVGGPEDIYERPVSEFVADFVGVINFIRGRVVSITPERQLLLVAAGGQELACVLHGNACPAVGDRVLLMLRPEKIQVHSHVRGEFAGEAVDTALPTNRLSARVESNVYCGDHRELNMITDDLAINVVAPNITDAEAGSVVQIEFSARDLHLLPQSLGENTGRNAGGNLAESPDEAQLLVQGT